MFMKVMSMADDFISTHGAEEGFKEELTLCKSTAWNESFMVV